MLAIGQLTSDYQLPTYTQPCPKLTWRAYYPTIRTAQQPQTNAPLPKYNFPLILWLALTPEQLTSAQQLADHGTIVFGLQQQPDWPASQLARQALLSLDCYGQSRQLNSLPLLQHTDLTKIGCCGLGTAGTAACDLQHRSHFIQTASRVIAADLATPTHLIQAFQTLLTAYRH